MKVSNIKYNNDLSSLIKANIAPMIDLIHAMNSLDSNSESTSVTNNTGAKIDNTGSDAASSGTDEKNLPLTKKEFRKQLHNYDVSINKVNLLRSCVNMLRRRSIRPTDINHAVIITKKAKAMLDVLDKDNCNTNKVPTADERSEQFLNSCSDSDTSDE